MDHAHALDNNLALYEAVLATHGVTGVLADAYWSTDAVVPAYWSNLLTRAGAQGRDAQMTRLAELAAAQPKQAWSLKDGFATLDEGALEALRLRRVFDGTWYGVPAGTSIGDARETACTFEVVDDPEGLAGWEASWQWTSPTDGVRAFPDACLARDDLVFLAARPEPQVFVGGVLANLSREAVGVSNVHAIGDVDDGAFARDAVREVARRFPGRHVVGYELGDGVDGLHPLPIQRLGPLRIYIAR